MASSSSRVPDVNNEDEYPPLTPYTSTHGVPFRPYTKPKTVKPDGSFEPLSSAEEVLNWQSKSHLAQRRHLVRQDEKLDKILHAVEKQESEVKHISQGLQDLHFEAHKKISKLEKALNKMVMQKEFGPLFDQKEAELRKLKRQ